MFSHSALEMVTRFNEAKTKEQCVEHLEAFTRGHGIEHFMIAEFVGPIEPDTMLEGHFPPEWTETYLGEQYALHDPIVHRLVSREGRDIIWSDLNKLVQRKSNAWKVMNEGRDFGLHEGVTYPILGYSGYVAGATFAGPRFDPDPEFRAALSLVAAYAHSRMLHIHREGRRPQEPVILTAREREVLRWAAQGKSDWEIGEILCISEHTAQKHIENVKRKLGVSKRIQAVVEAVKRSLIRI